MTTAPQGSKYQQEAALVTGANSGLGFEAAAQLADAGYGRVILACRTLEKAEQARRQLAERVGHDPFETIAVDVSSVKSAQAAAEELVKRAHQIDALLLNAGMVSGSEMKKSEEGLELAFASSIIGHHVLTMGLLDAGLLPKGARVVIAGSEAARNDLPAMMDMKLYDFAIDVPSEFGDNLHDAMLAFARGELPDKFNEMRYYAVTKVFVSWWSAIMAQQYGEEISVFAVSPGSSMATNAGRNIKGLKGFMFSKVMPLVGPLFGMHQHVSVAAKRYIDVLNAEEDEFANGATYTSKAKKLVGPLHKMTYPHLLNEEKQTVAWNVLNELTGTVPSSLGGGAA